MDCYAFCTTIMTTAVSLPSPHHMVADRRARGRALLCCAETSSTSGIQGDYRATDLRGRSWSVDGAVAHCCCLDFWMSMCGTFWCKSGRRPRQRGRKIAKMPGLGGRKNPTQFRSICRRFLFGSPSNSRFSFSFIGNLPSGQQQNIPFFSNSMNFHI